MNWEQVKQLGWVPRDGKNLRILSLDGGGIRGIFPATYLARFEKETGSPINQYFDLIVGTSTGGILALGLSIGIPAEELATMYIMNAANIFKKKKLSIRGILSNQFKNDGLRNMLEAVFKNKRIADADVMLCIPSVEHSKASPKVFKTPHCDHLFNDYKYSMSDVALATSAAPTYFPAVKVDGNDCKIDGGLWANNPALVGIAEAFTLGFNVDTIKMLSIGTGSHMYAVDNKIAEKSSLIRYRSRIVDLTMQLQTTSADYTARHLLKDNIHRVDFQLKKPMKLSETKLTRLQELQYEANNQFMNSYVKVNSLFSQYTQATIHSGIGN
ncbi:CBASS cGAMP-activated phospholipase [Paenibacillus favisporus]|uniref:CBASS cGAMP-activated phospholipase n=1 Tax=Paenibacillus favisporus TaxID=221028 RepID=UPI002DBFCC9E|nr:CBASS cGAMP-activated phospholipase [Paenibacillus favisporus]MEC0174564.1 CBASS cGAMP-activated phospholipase [Paenibacillus favisporus]